MIGTNGSDWDDWNPWDTPGRDIAYGHAWRDHRTDTWNKLGIDDREQLADYLDNIIKFPKRQKKHGDKTYYLGEDGTIVIENPTGVDLSTAFNPDVQGVTVGSEEYFDNLPGAEVDR